ncbi:MAG: hypothetical protein N0A03_10430, partial [Anaerolineae bacterium]|nr:hypothetical protein [Anaerolineae bacterium]
MKQDEVSFKVGILLISLLLLPGLMGCGAISSLVATPTPTPTLTPTATPTPTPLPGIPFSKEESVEVASISSIVGQGTVYFKPGKEAGTLRVEITATVPVVNGKTCYFCVNTIIVAPGLKIGLKWFEEESVETS